MPDSLLRARRTEAARRRRRVRRTKVSLAVAGAVAVIAAIILTTQQTPGARARPSHANGGATRHAASPLVAQPDPTVQAIDSVERQMSYVRVGGSAHRYIALTFDDGPSPYTDAVLRVLKQRHAAATFFQVGRMIPVFEASARATSAAGFPVGDHTEDHPPLAALGPSAQSAQVLNAIARMRAAGEPTPQLFRPPYMSFNRTTLSLLRQLHMLMVLWTVDSEDYRLPGVNAIVYRVLSGARPGAIVLMHDGGGLRAETVAALPRIIDALRQRHYTLVTVPELVLKDPPTPESQRPPGTRFSSAG